MFNNELAWTRSSRCAQGDCVEARAVDGRVEVRDSKLGDDSPVLSFGPAEWARIVAQARQLGSFPTGVRVSGAGVVWQQRARRLAFDRGEWMEFLGGVDRGEFDVDRLMAPARS